MLKNYKIILIITFLIGVILFSIFKYVVTLREKYDLAIALDQAKGQIAILENEKQNLLQTIEKEKIAQRKLSEMNLELKDYLKASRKRLTRLFKDYALQRKLVQEDNKKIILLRTENKALIKSRAKIMNENTDYLMRLNSITELRKAIKEINSGIYTYKLRKNPQGNQGFVIKDGKPTCAAKIKIQVEPAASQN